MSEERNEDKDVERLKKELKELIDHRIEYNNGFTNLLRGDYSLFISLIFLIMSVFGAWKLGFLAQHYVLSVYSVLVIWWLYVICGIKSIMSDLKKREQEGVSKQMSIDQKEIKAIFGKSRPIYFSLSIMFFLCIVVLWYFKDFRLWLLVPNVILGLSFLCLAWNETIFKTIILNSLNLLRIEVKDEVGSTKFSNLSILISFAVFVLTIPFLLYYIARGLYFINFQDPYSILGMILTIILILISLGFLSEYLSMKFMVTEVSNQNYKLSVLRTGIDRIENAEALENNKKELLKWYLPKAGSFLVFFNYYYPEVGEGDEEAKEEESG